MNTAYHIAIIGTGLIGGSLAKALLAVNSDHRISAIEPDDTSRGEMAGMSDNITLYNAVSDDALANIDMLIIATPPSAWHEIAQQLDALDTSHIALIMDVGSIKSYALECFGQLPQFVAAHPIAGSEFSGAAYADASLFTDKRVILTPTESTDQDSAILAVRFWEMLHAQPLQLDADAHDRIYAHISHLPQFCAYALSGGGALIHAGGQHDIIGFARLAGSSPELWLSIFRYNSHLSDVCETFLQLLCHMIAELHDGTPDEDGTPLQLDIGIAMMPRIIASCLISVVTLEEKRSDHPVSLFAGAGFVDMSHPAVTPPEDDLDVISQHPRAVIALLEMVESMFRTMLICVKKEDWDGLHTLMHDARTQYVNLLN